MTIPMALVDFLPTFLFLASMVLLLKRFYDAMSRNVYTLFAGGAIMSFLAGFLETIWKLLYAANVCNFVPLRKMFMPTQAIGFVLLAVAVVWYLVESKSEKVCGFAPLALIPLVAAEAPKEYSGTVIFIILLVLGALGFFGGLCVYAVRKKCVLPAVLFIIALLIMLSMGYLAAQDSMSPLINWIEEFVNLAGQICLFVGVLVLHKKDAQKK